MPIDILETLLQRGVLAPEEAAWLFSRGLGSDPTVTLVASRLVDRDTLARVLGESERPERSHHQKVQGAGSAPFAPVFRAGMTLPAPNSWESTLGLRREAMGGDNQRYRLERHLRTDAGRDVWEATDLDLDRPVEIHMLEHAPALSPARGQSRGRVRSLLTGVAECLQGVQGSGVPLLYETGETREGRPFLALSPPSGEALSEMLGLPDPLAVRQRDTLQRMVEAARVLERAHAAGFIHLGLDLSTLYVGHHGEITIVGWGSPQSMAARGGGPESPPPRPSSRPQGSAGQRPGPGPLERGSGSWDESGERPGKDPFRAPELERGISATPAADIFALGRVVACVAAWTPRPPLRSRLHPAREVPREVMEVVRRATRHRPKDRYPSMARFAGELEASLAGEPIPGLRPALRRRIGRALRRHPYLSVCAALSTLTLLLLGSVVFVEALLQRGREERLELLRTERAEEILDEIAEMAAEFDRHMEAEARVCETIREVHARRTEPGTWRPRELPPEILAKEVRALAEREEATLASRALLSSMEGLVSEAIAISSGARTHGHEILLRSVLRRVRADIEEARFEEDRDLSTRTLSAALATGPVEGAIASSSSGGPMEAPDFEALLLELSESWRAAARGLLLAARLQPEIGTPLDREFVSLLGSFLPEGTVVVGRIPEGARASHAEMLVSSRVRARGLEDSLRSGERLRLPIGEHLFLLSDGHREVVHPVLVSRGEVYEWKPDWPDSWPPGDFVYIPPGRFRAGGEGEGSGAYRTERVEKGFFIGRHEISIGEYIEALADLRDNFALPPETLAAGLPRDPTARGPDFHLVGPDLTPVPEYALDMPAGGVVRPLAERYAEWMSLRRGEGWEFRLPTEAEWEYAARGAVGRLYPWGDTWDADLASVRPRGVGASTSVWWRSVDSLPEGASVFGLHHLAGNVLEWTGSDDGHYLAVIRGAAGWFQGGGSWTHSAGRGSLHPLASHPDFGFRLACSAMKAE